MSTDLSLEIPHENDGLGKDEQQVDQEDWVEHEDQAVQIVAHLRGQIETLNYKGESQNTRRRSTPIMMKRRTNQYLDRKRWSLSALKQKYFSG